MRSKATKAVGATAIALAIGAVAAPAASAATPATQPSATPVGSVAVCLNIPVGPLSFSVCL